VYDEGDTSKREREDGRGKKTLPPTPTHAGPLILDLICSAPWRRSSSEGNHPPSAIPHKHLVLSLLWSSFFFQRRYIQTDRHLSSLLSRRVFFWSVSFFDIDILSVALLLIGSLPLPRWFYSSLALLSATTLYYSLSLQFFPAEKHPPTPRIHSCTRKPIQGYIGWSISRLRQHHSLSLSLSLSLFSRTAALPGIGRGVRQTDVRRDRASARDRDPFIRTHRERHTDPFTRKPRLTLSQTHTLTSHLTRIHSSQTHTCTHISLSLSLSLSLTSHKHPPPACLTRHP